MKIEEAIVYCLTTSNRGMRTEQIADMINRQRLHHTDCHAVGEDDFTAWLHHPRLGISRVSKRNANFNCASICPWLADC